MNGVSFRRGTDNEYSRGQQRETVRLNGVSLCGGEDNEYGCGQRRGTAEGNVEWKKPKRAKRPNKPNGHCSIKPLTLQIIH